MSEYDSGYEEDDDLSETIRRLKDGYVFLSFLANVWEQYDDEIKYLEGHTICEQYLNYEVSLERFVALMLAKNLHEDLYHFKDDFPDNLRNFLVQCGAEE